MCQDGPHLPAEGHEGVPEGAAVPQALEDDVEEAVVLARQVAQARGQGHLGCVRLQLHHCLPRVCQSPRPLLRQAGLQISASLGGESDQQRGCVQGQQTPLKLLP